MTELKHSELFLNAKKVRFSLVSQRPSESIPYLDFEFEDGDLRTMATLTYNVEDQDWFAVIRIAEDEEADFDDGADATPEQIEILKAALPEAELKLVETFQAEHDLSKGVGPAGLGR